MAKPRFSVRFPETFEPAIYYDITISARKRVRGLTNQIIVDGTRWNVKDRIAAGDKIQAAEINTALGKFEEVVETFIRKNKTEPNLKEELKAKIEEYFGRIELDNKDKIPTFKEYINQFIEEKENEIGDHAVSSGTIGEYKNFQKVLLEYEKGRTMLSFDRINKIFYQKYIAFLKNEKQYSINTIGKHIKSLKAIVNAAWVDQYHDNRSFIKFKVLKEKSKNIAFLNKDQLNDLANLELTEKEAAARDYFLLMSYTGLRVSNMMELTNDNIIVQDGVRLIVYDVDKDKDQDELAFIITPEMETILDKYNGGFPIPKITSNYINLVIKELTGNPEIHNHTGRRNYCTNAFLQNDPVIPVPEIMLQSNHKKEKTFYDYIKATGREVAAAIAKRRKK